MTEEYFATQLDRLKAKVAVGTGQGGVQGRWQSPTAKKVVRFLVAEGGLMHYLNFSVERPLPPMQKLLDQPFWLDPSDPHRMAAAMQVVSRPLAHDYAVYAEEWRIWAWAINRVATDGINPEQAIDEAIARIKQIPSE